MAYSHSSKVRSVLRTYSCSDFTSSCSRNLARGSGVSSKLRITAAVSSVSLNWRIFAVLRDRRRLASAYTTAPHAVSRAGWNGAHFSAIKVAYSQPEIRADVSPHPRLARVSRNVESGARPSRKSPEAALRRRRAFPGHAAPDLSPRQGRPFDRAGLCRYRAQGGGQGRHDLPHLFDDQAAHERRLHDAGRGRPRRTRRARAQVHPG